MFKRIGILVSLCSVSVAFGNRDGYLFCIKNLTDVTESVSGVSSIREKSSLYSISNGKTVNVQLGDKGLNIETKEYTSRKTPSTFLYPKVSGNIGKPWKLVSDGRGTYTLILADSTESIDSEEEEEQSQYQQSGMEFDRITVQSSTDSE